MFPYDIPEFSVEIEKNIEEVFERILRLEAVLCKDYSLSAPVEPPDNIEDLFGRIERLEAAVCKDFSAPDEASVKEFSKYFVDVVTGKTKHFDTPDEDEIFDDNFNEEKKEMDKFEVYEAYKVWCIRNKKYPVRRRFFESEFAPYGPTKAVFSFEQYFQ